MERKQVNLYLATSLKGPKRRDGAYGWVLERKTAKGAATLSNVKTISTSTEHQSLLTAMLEAAKRLNEMCDITVYTDDEYMGSALSRWMEQWAAAGWMNKRGTPVADADRWQELYDVLNGQNITVELKENHEYHDWLEREVMEVAKGKAFTPV